MHFGVYTCKKEETKKEMKKKGEEGLGYLNLKKNAFWGHT